MNSQGLTQYLLPISLGLIAVLQAGLNRRIGTVYGISGASLLNAIMFLLAAMAFYYSGLIANQKLPFSEFKLWYLIPGLLGFCLVVGLPTSIAKWGAANTFLWLISSQLVVSVFWDFVIEGQPFSYRKLIGGTIAIIGAWIAVQ